MRRAQRMLYVLVLATESIPSTTSLIITGSEKNTRFRRFFVITVWLKKPVKQCKTRKTTRPTGSTGIETLGSDGNRIKTWVRIVSFQFEHSGVESLGVAAEPVSAVARCSDRVPVDPGAERGMAPVH